MKVNSKRNEGHHLPCLSSLSQAPLIGENTSERLTPISAHSLQSNHQSPNRISLNQTMKPITSTPLLPNYCVSSESNAPPTVFFPALQNKTNSVFSEPNIFFNSTGSGGNNNNGSNGSHKIMDLNMNVENERDRENCNTSQKDEHYHVYEPLDLDEEQTTSVSVHQTFQRNPTSNLALLHTLDNHHQAPLPPTPRSSTTQQNSISEEWTTKGQASSPLVTSEVKRSPQFVQQDGRSSAQCSQRAAPAPFSDRSTSFCENIAEDVYFKYVTLKSSVRTNHRSRSYHGPKNIITGNGQACDDQPLLNIEGSNRNMSSSGSVSEIPASPVAAFSPTAAIPFRDHCIRELVETEGNYVCALEMIIMHFARHLENLLRPDENTRIFGLIRKLYHHHSIFHNDLLKAAYRLLNRDLPSLPSPTSENLDQMSSNPTTPTLVGDRPFFASSPLSSPSVTKDLSTRTPRISTCFLNMKEKFLLYGEYCANLSKAQALLDELTSKNETIAAQLDFCQQNASEGKFKLRDLLSLPMQRILKYHLLLAQLIKNTSSSSDDYQGLKRAHETMVDLGQYINEVKRDTEAIQIINEIEQSIVELNLPANTSLIDYGRLVTDGFIRIRAPPRPKAKSAHDLSKIKLPHDTKLKQKRYVFVFDKVILICKLSGLRRYQFKDALNLSKCELDLNPAMPSDTISRHTVKDKWNYSFTMHKTDDRTSYSFFAKTMEMRNKWVNAIQKAMDNTRPAACRGNSNMGHEFFMHKFDKPSSCDQCGKLLLGLYYQGYRCGKCFSSVHKKCLPLARACGSKPPTKSSATLAHTSNRSKVKEPASPSVQSTHSDNGHSVFTNFPLVNSNGAPCTEPPPKNDHNNLAKGRQDAAATSSSFRENGPRTAPINQRPVSSMINVSLQNSKNQLIHQKRLLKNSTSSPSINQQPSLRVKAHCEFDGDESRSEMKIATGDVILVTGDHCAKSTAQDLIDGPMSQLTISLNADDTKGAWLFGRNLRTGLEGRFPSQVVKTVQLEQNEPDDLMMHSNSELMTNSQPTQSYVNFSPNDEPWFIDLMDRDTAQALLEEAPHETFLVRVSTKHHNSHVISLKYNNKVMHMRIYVSEDNQFYLSQNRYFNSLADLISWYQENSLVESFNMLDARLTIPYKLR